MRGKITAPTLPSALLHRTSLISRLRELLLAQKSPTEAGTPQYKLFFLCTPAGYGKTTLLADFVHQTGLSCCWYFLDQSDTVPLTFLTTLLASIRQRFPGFGASLDALLSRDSSRADDPRRVQTCVDALVTALEVEITERFAFLLCNYQEVDSHPAIANLINQLVQRMPAHGMVMIESRSTPALEFASLLARRQAIGWSSNTLRLTAGEIQELAHVQGVAPLSTLEAEQLATVFEGWIVGILLGTRLGDVELLRASVRTGILEGLPSMRVDREKLLDYFIDDVFNQQPELYAFLKEAAVLQQMTPDLCDALLGISNSSEYLEHLTKQGMFVSCCDEGSQPVYSCHPVLRELLSDELRRTAPQRFLELHRRAASLFEASHAYEQAIPHAMIAGDSQQAVQLIIQMYREMTSRKSGERLLRWIGALPTEIAESCPQLLLIRANIYLMRTEYTHALPLLDAASALLTSSSLTSLDPTDLPRLQAELMLLRGKAFFQIGRYQEGRQICQQVLEATPVDEVALRAEAHTYFGICTTLLGGVVTGIEHLQKALQLWGRNSVRYQTAEAYSALANNYTFLGNFALIEHHLARSISIWEELQDEKGKASNLLRLGHQKHLQGSFDEALSILHQTLTMVQGKPGFEREEGYVLENLADIYLNQGLYSQSLQVAEQGIDLARQLGDHYLINICLSHLSLTYLLMGDAATALLFLSEMNLPSENNENISHQRVLHDLAYGLILLHQHRYEEASTFLIDLEASLKKAGYQFDLLRARLYLAACQIALAKQEEAIHSLEKIIAILESHDFGQLLLLWLRNQFPEVYQLVKTQPALARLRTLLHIEQAAQECKTPTTQGTTSATQPLSSNHATVKIQAFGEPAVYVDERPVTRWRMARAMELFFYLLDCGRPMRKEQILTALWPEIDEQINQTFHSTVHYLRKALVDAAIVSRGGSYSLDLSALGNQVQYDVAIFQDLFGQAKHFLTSEDDTAAREALLALVQLYHGDYVQSFYSDWCAFRRDQLRRMYLEARNQLAQLAWKQEAFDEGALHWQHMLAIDGCLEEAHYGLMRYYARTGKRGLALRQYQRCVQTLEQELSARPGPVIQSFYQRLTGFTEPVKKVRTTSPLHEEASHM